MSVLQKTRRLNPADYELSKVQDYTSDAIDSVISQEIVNGNLLTNIKTTAGTPINIRHGLSQSYRGYIVVRSVASSAITVYEVAPTTTFPATTFVTLVPSATGTMSLWCF